MHFSRLRLQGFKSFVEPTDLDIRSGMTGIVGPNGCGKSNLVEALKWVMGETSAKRMRGADMDDVIFAGTTMRPSRNLAEVTLTLDNSDKSALAEYNNEDELIVTRKIERGNGSDYRLNGKAVRQRDIQLLFADQATGAHSTSVVGQGQIDALIRAKPQDRRQILEEASGTAGLQARRHEAELKLKATEQNLTRLDDVLQALDTQLRSLKTQVRQASRYRNLAEHIRRTEAALLHLKWMEGEQNAEGAHKTLSDTESKANELLSVVTRGHTERAEAAAELPGLRQAEAVAAAIVQKLTLAREQLDAEVRRAESDIKAQEHNISQTQEDLTRETARLSDSEAALARLGAEETQLAARDAEIDLALPGLEELVALSASRLETLDVELATLVSEAAEVETKLKALRHEGETLALRKKALDDRHETLESQLAEVNAEIAAQPDLSLASSMVGACEAELEKRRTQTEDAEKARLAADAGKNAQRDVTQTAQDKVTKLKASADAIKAMLAHEANEVDQVVDALTVTPGLETALAVALGEALTATLDTNAAMHWRDLPPLDEAQGLPHGAAPLDGFIKAPSALNRSLSQIGLVETRDEGMAAQASLKPGQILVSRDGWAWRWDGYTVTPEAKTATALRLQQRNRLTALETEIMAAEDELRTEMERLESADALLTECQKIDSEARQALQAAFAALNDARDLHTRQERQATAAHTKRTTLEETLAQIAPDRAEVEARMKAVETEITSLPTLDILRTSLETRRAELAEARAEQAAQRSERDRLAHEKKLSTDRRSAIAGERGAWENRLASANMQRETLTERLASLQATLGALQGKPAELTTRRETLLTELNDAEKVRREAADTLIRAEQKVALIEHQLKRDEEALGAAREDKVRAEAALQAVDEHFKVLAERIAEKLECTPEELKSNPELEKLHDAGGNLPSVFELEQTLGRYNRERENMGPVNLRAEIEAEAAEAEIARLTQEKDDLVSAVAKLRQGISQLNREARERLQTAFVEVNEKFQKLFTHLFGGGKAHLELIDNEDPLNAGLEIFACPPGKKMQILSLLSGGERTLTALALLFAVFQTNPSPICVLDEAEAALDESNIGRFCNLVEEIARETGTRFLIITHQRLTMARMDRLFGVTMSEKGVSQLVSVDLENAVALRDGKKIDAATAATETMHDIQVA